MNKDMYNLASWSLQVAKKAGANDCRIEMVNSRLVDIEYRLQKPDSIKEASKKNLTIDIYTEGRYSRQKTSDLRQEALQTFIGNAVKTTKLLAEDSYRSLPDPKYFENISKRDLKVYDKSYEDLTPQMRHDLVKNIEKACWESGGDRVISVSAYTGDTSQESLMITSNGFEGYQKNTYFQAFSEMTVQDEGDRRPTNYYYITSTSRNEILQPKKIGKETAQRTLNLLGAKKIKTETLPIIVENRVVPRILQGCLEAMSGSNIQQKQSFLADKKGEKIASDRFTLVDDPFISGGLGSQLYDNDGMAAKKRTMVDNGILKEFYIDWYYSRKLGWEPTSGGHSNLVIPPGKRAVKQIMQDLERGILVTGFIGGNSNSTTGDFSVGISGQLFEKGEFTQTVAEMNIADNHMVFWGKLAEVANDIWLYSTYHTPSLVFSDIVVSGT